MTNRELLNFLNTLTDEQLDCDVAVFDASEMEGFTGVGVGLAGISTEMDGDDGGV